MDRNHYEHTLVRQTRVCADIAKAVNEAIAWPIFDQLSLRELHYIKRVIIVGCGDSWIAGFAAKPVFEKYARVRADVVRCIDFSRHLSKNELGDTPGNPLVIGISITGNASRLAEALERANKYGAQTIGITNKPTSLCGSLCQHVIPLGLPEGMEMNPGCNTYNASTAAMMQLALRIGRAKNTISQNEYERLRTAPLRLISQFAAKGPDYEQQAFEIAQKWRSVRGFDFVGDYGDYATAYFGLAKAHEGIGGYSMCSNSEDWLCGNRNAPGPASIARLIIANQNSGSFDRACEVIRQTVKLGSPCLVVTDAEKDAFPEGCNVVTTPKSEFSWAYPLVQHHIYDMIALYIRMLNKETDGYIYRDKEVAPGYSSPALSDGKRIWGSKIEII